MAVLSIERLPSASTVAIGLITFILLVHFQSGRKQHPKEPTVLRPWIPVIGHLLGMALLGGRYVKKLGLSHGNLPIFTLPVPGSRIYVVTEPALAGTVQRQSKALSFTPLVPDITKRVLGLDAQTVAMIRENLDPEPGDPRGFLADSHDMIYGSLGPGQYLTELSCQASQELSQQLASYVFSSQSSRDATQGVDLLSWIRHFVTVGTAQYLYGPNNPISLDPALEDAFWAFDHGLGGLLMGLLPSITAAQAYRGRERVVKAFMGYLDNGHQRSASKIVSERIRLEEEYGMSQENIARSALSFLFAGIVNTTTTTFWVILRLFADVNLLARVRQEVNDAVIASEEEGGPGCWSIGQVKDGCPTLMAVFRESLRVGSENFSVRLVKDDVMLADKYHLRKGSVVQIAGGVIHANKSIWGDNVEEFHPERFLTQKARSGGIHPAAFRSFGGGKTMCPGRHFATNEIVVFAAMIIRAFDMSSPEGGVINVPQKNDKVMPVHILEPHSKDCPKVLIKARPEAEEFGSVKVVM